MNVFMLYLIVKSNNEVETTTDITKHETFFRYFRNSEALASKFL